MINGKVIPLALAIIAVLTMASVASAAINTVNPGNTVFIGEQGLDICGVVGASTQLGWWASGAAIDLSSPSLPACAEGGRNPGMPCLQKPRHSLSWNPSSM